MMVLVDKFIKLSHHHLKSILQRASSVSLYLNNRSSKFLAVSLDSQKLEKRRLSQALQAATSKRLAFTNSRVNSQNNKYSISVSVQPQEHTFVKSSPPTNSSKLKRSFYRRILLSNSGSKRINGMTQPTINYFGHSFIDRCSDKRKDKEWIESQLHSDQSVFILFHVDKPFVKKDELKKTFSLRKFNYDKVKHLLVNDTKAENGDTASKKCTVVFLGLEYEKNSEFLETCVSECRSPYSNPELYGDKTAHKAWFAVDTSGYDRSVENVNKAFSTEDGEFFEGNLLRLMAIQDTMESSIIAQARSVLCWLDRNKFCASCGSANTIQEAGHKLSCSNAQCKSNDRQLNKYVPSNIHYPRVDPVVIMLVVNPARTHFLLGRKKQFPPNMFSCLAGYVEAGESIEEAVRREVFEESGLYTDNVVYHSSQPWPFPSTLMIGCLAYATSNDIKVDKNEIEDAQWFSLDEIDLIVKSQHPNKITIPTERTIANQLINYFIKNKSKL